jgi:uncharacterized protein YecE (DUF72 family)
LTRTRAHDNFGGEEEAKVNKAAPPSPADSHASSAAGAHVKLAPSIRIGPAGWSYPDWAGIVYPRSRSRCFHEAEYLSQFFDTIEINTSFYQPLQPEMARSWIGRVAHNPRFVFTAKLWKRFTHHRDAGRDEERAVKRGIDPLAEEKRLGALLLQFPWSFKWSRENREYLGALAMEFVEYPLVVEVRHSSWDRPEAFELMGDLGLGFCNIDQPIVGRSLAPTAEAIGPVGYVRLHGRNYNQWFGATEPHERYNYLYSMEELEPWAERVRRVGERSQTTFVITNNHFEGKAVANALELEALLTGEPVRVPPSLVSRYPELREIAAPNESTDAAPSVPEQGTLAFELAENQSAETQ